MKLAENFINEVGQKAIVRAEEEIYQEATSNYLANLTEKIAEDLAVQEEKTMQERLSFNRRVSKMGRAKSAPKKVKKTKVTEDEIDKKVDDKIRKMMPTLVEMITKKVEASITKKSCIKC